MFKPKEGLQSISRPPLAQTTRGKTNQMTSEAPAGRVVVAVEGQDWLLCSSS